MHVAPENKKKTSVYIKKIAFTMRNKSTGRLTRTLYMPFTLTSDDTGNIQRRAFTCTYVNVFAVFV